MEVYLEEFREDNKSPKNYITKCDYKQLYLIYSDDHGSSLHMEPSALSKKYEDNSYCRISVSPSIDSYLVGITEYLRDVNQLFVYVPEDMSKVKQVKPSKLAVPEADITDEVWITNSVDFKRIGKIQVTGTVGEPLPFTYGEKGQYTGYLNKWTWDWIDKPEEEYIKEEMGIPLVKPGCPHCNAIIYVEDDWNYTGVCYKCGKFYKEYDVKDSDLKDSDFAIPSERRFPINNEKYVNHILKQFTAIDDDYREEVASRMLPKARDLKLSMTITSENSPIWKYAGEYPDVIKHWRESTNESTIIDEANIMEVREFFSPRCQAPIQAIRNAVNRNDNASWNTAYRSMEIFYKESKRKHTVDCKDWVLKYLEDLSNKCDIGFKPSGNTWDSIHTDCMEILSIINERKSKSVVKEDALSTKERNDLSDDKFGIPEERKYPLVDKEHVLQAIRWFNKCEDKYKRELCDNICKMATEYGMRNITIGDNNDMKKYLQHVEPDYKYFIKEETEIPWETYQDGFYHPEEIADLIDSDRGETVINDDITLKEWFDYYTNRCAGLCLYDEKYEKAWYNKLKVANESEMMMLGWNPKMEFTSTNRKIAANRLISEIKSRNVRTNIEESVDIEQMPDSIGKAIIDGGYEMNGRWNSVEIHEEYPNKLLRHRVEILIFKDNDVFLYKTSNGYEIPGGSIERNVDNMRQVQNEAMEEARIICKDVKHTGLTYYKIYNENDIRKGNGIQCDGEFTEIYTGTYDSAYEGKIDTRDEEPEMVKNGKFYSILAIKDILIPEHKKLCMFHLYGLVNEAASALEFDNRGNLIINKAKLNYQKEYDKSHKLLLSYEATDNIDGMKLEICKLWYINSKIESKLDGAKNRKELMDIRARVLNDFNKYIKLINTNDKSFNFSEYIKSTPYDPDNIVLSKSTLFNAADFVKHILNRK